LRTSSPFRNPWAIGIPVACFGAAGLGWWIGRASVAEEAGQLHRALVDLLLNALSADDPDTEEHSRRVADLVDVLVERLPCDRAERATLRLAALLHDMGKIDDQFFDIVHSRDPLSDAQRQTIKSHPHESAHILEPLEQLHPGITRIVCSHHECWNGSGYPNGLKEDEIPFGARLIAVADVFDALTQWRSYREPAPVEEAFRAIREGAGSKFDPAVATLAEDPEVQARWREIVARGHQRCRARRVAASAT
jgi:putative nucleotidyltransferase with HDIG domain